MQCNARRCYKAQVELIHAFNASDAEVLLLQEPYTGSLNTVQSIYDLDLYEFPQSGRKVKACIVLKRDLGSAIAWTQHSTPNLAIVQVALQQRKLYLISAYLEPDNDKYGTSLSLDLFLKETSNSLHVIGADANGAHPMWGCDTLDARGDEINNMASSNCLVVVNIGSDATFEAPGPHDSVRTSIVDITLVSENMADKVRNWIVNPEIAPLSDHHAITFSISNVRVQRSNERNSTYLFNNKTADWTSFASALQGEMDKSMLLHRDLTALTPNELDQFVLDLTTVIQAACRSSMKLRGTRSPAAPFWTPELDKLKKEVISLHHKLSQISKRGHDPTQASVQLRKAKKTYSDAMSRTSTKHFRTFCCKQGKEDVWSLTNRLIKDCPRQQPVATLLTAAGYTDSPESTATALVHHFYPDDNSDDEVHQPLRMEEDLVSNGGPELLFTTSEVLTALETMSPDRAPGHDHLTSDICMSFAQQFPDLLTSLMNRCLDLSHFPTTWKDARVRILRKPGKEDYKDLSSYRPIGLLPVLGKVLEKLTIQRLTFRAQKEGQWSETQFGFRQQRSTSDALHSLIEQIKDGRSRKQQVLGISLDIKAAFDNAWWPALMDRLRRTSCPRNLHLLIQSYLTDRRVQVDLLNASVSKSMTKGCVQGSVCGPTFWNLILDSLLETALPSGCHIQAYADDVMLLVTGGTPDEVQANANQALDLIHNWGSSVKLTFSPAKTVAIAFTQGLSKITVAMKDQLIPLQDHIKLLGVVIDKSLTFTKHVRHVIAKVTRTFKSLCKFIKPTWGVHPENMQILYHHVIEPTITYAAEIWGSAVVKYESARKALRQFQRSFAIRTVRAFHTVSAVSACAIAGFVPLHLKVQEVRRIEKVKRTGTFEDLPDDVELDRRVKPQDLLHPAVRPSIPDLTATSQADVDLHSSPTNIFTDGSKLETGEVGCAFVIDHPNGRREARKFRLDQCCSVYQAELFAIEKALDWTSKHARSSVTIFTDSLSSIKSIQDRNSTNAFVCSITHMLHQLKDRLEVRLVWVKAHIGIDGNEAADLAAKEAAVQKRAKAFASFPLSYAKLIIRREVQDLWQEEYSSADTGGTTRAYFPTLDLLTRFIRTSGLSFELTQVLTGHGFHRQYLKRFHITTTENCPCDQQTVQDLTHILTACPRFVHLGKDHFSLCAKLEVHPLDLASVPLHPKLTESLLSFISSVVRTIKSINSID